MEQLKLLLRDEQKAVSLEIIASCKTLTEALRLCKSISGLEDKQIAMMLEIDPGHFSLIWDHNNKRHFPEAKLIQFMELCNNKVPLIWLALKCGYTLQPLKTEIEAENDRLRIELEQERIQHAAIKTFLKEIGAKI